MAAFARLNAGSSQAVDSAASEAVARPEPGLARGRWEASPWVFYAVAAVVLLAAAGWVTTRLRARKVRL